MKTRIMAILNVTDDSFSDGGRYREVDAACARAAALVAEGADIIDVGAESTHPSARAVPPAEQIERLTPVVQRVQALRRDGANIAISVDAYDPQVQRAMVRLGVDYLNDVTAVGDPESRRLIADSGVSVIAMHSRSTTARAQQRDVDPGTVVTEIVTFFQRRLAELEAAGVRREQVILDPGMGFFLGRNPRASLAVLCAIDQIATLRGTLDLSCPVCISTSRKSFIGALLPDVAGTPRAVDERSAGTLASEIWAAEHGAAIIRTHAPRALRDALTVWAHLRVESHREVIGAPRGDSP